MGYQEGDKNEKEIRLLDSTRSRFCGIVSERFVRKK